MGNEFLKQVRDEMERAYRPPKGAGQVDGGASDEIASLESAALRSTISALHASYALVGQLPPQPPTLRGRVGMWLVRLVNWVLSWYSRQIVYFQYSALRALEEQAKTLDRAEKRIRLLEEELARQRAQNDDVRRA